MPLALTILNYSTNCYFFLCRCITKIIDVAREKIQLIFLLNLLNDINKMKDERMVSHSAEIIKEDKQCSVQIQTETHPICYNKRKSYTWNIWELHRKTIQLSKLTKCHTKSTQTDISCNHFNVGTQTFYTVHNNCQTNVNKSTQK